MFLALVGSSGVYISDGLLWRLLMFSYLHTKSFLFCYVLTGIFASAYFIAPRPVEACSVPKYCPGFIDIDGSTVPTAVPAVRIESSQTSSDGEGIPFRVVRIDEGNEELVETHEELLAEGGLERRLLVFDQELVAGARYRIEELNDAGGVSSCNASPQSMEFTAVDAGNRPPENLMLLLSPLTRANLERYKGKKIDDSCGGSHELVHGDSAYVDASIEFDDALRAWSNVMDWKLEMVPQGAITSNTTIVSAKMGRPISYEEMDKELFVSCTGKTLRNGEKRPEGTYDILVRAGIPGESMESMSSPTSVDFDCEGAALRDDYVPESGGCSVSSVPPVAAPAWLVLIAATLRSRRRKRG